MEKAHNIFERIWGKAHNTDQKQWQVIAMCILGAMTFWFFSALNKQDYSTNITYPITIDYPGKDSLMVIGSLPSSLRINVTGGGWNLFRTSFGIGIKPIELQLNDPVETRFVLGASLVPTINDQVSSFNLNHVITDTLFIHIESRVSRSLILALDPEGLNLATDHLLIGEIEIDPDTVQVEGPATYINNLMDTFYLDITQNNINENFQQNVAMPNELKEVTWGTKNVGVSFRVDPLIPVTLKLPLELLNFPEGYGLDRFSDISVTFQLPSSYADSLNAEDLQAFVDFDHMSKDSLVIPQTRSNHPYVTNLSAETASLKVVNEN